jgi:ABC-type Mn2+/Zn2+ transport system permease subunit
VIAAPAVIDRPLLFSTVDPDAEARGVPMRALNVAVFLLLTLTTAEAAAQRLTARPAAAVLLSIEIAVVATEGGILLSLQKAWPTSFISTISFAICLAARGWHTLRQ